MKVRIKKFGEFLNEARGPYGGYCNVSGEVPQEWASTLSPREFEQELVIEFAKIFNFSPREFEASGGTVVVDGTIFSSDGYGDMRDLEWTSSLHDMDLGQGDVFSGSWSIDIPLRLARIEFDRAEQSKQKLMLDIKRSRGILRDIEGIAVHIYNYQ